MSIRPMITARDFRLHTIIGLRIRLGSLEESLTDVFPPVRMGYDKGSNTTQITRQMEQGYDMQARETNNLRTMRCNDDSVLALIPESFDFLCYEMRFMWIAKFGQENHNCCTIILLCIADDDLKWSLSHRVISHRAATNGLPDCK